jgi:transposase
MEATMSCRSESGPVGHRDSDHNRAALYVSLELSPSKWLATSLVSGTDKLSKHLVPGGDCAALLRLLAALKAKAEKQSGMAVVVATIQEAGLDGFSLHRLLEANGVETWIVDPASVAVPRRARRAKSDAIDGETLLRTLLAYRRGEPRVCSMVHPTSPHDEDRRRLSRERRTLMRERIEHTNRIKGLLMSQGISGYDPLRKNRLVRLDELTTRDGHRLLPRLRAEIGREIDRLELLARQLKQVEAERDALIFQAADVADSPAGQLMRLKGIGVETATLLWLEGLFRTFANRRQLAAYAGLAPTPWLSGRIRREQGISKSGNPRLRTGMVELAWLWLRNQPASVLSRWFADRVRKEGGRKRRITIVALARKLLVALWKYVNHGEVPEGAALKPV